MDRSAAIPSWCRFDFTNPVVARSRALYDQNLILLEESYRRIALGHQLLNKARGVERGPMMGYRLRPTGTERPGRHTR